MEARPSCPERYDVSSSIAALMTRVNSPSESQMSGSEKNLTTGLTAALTRPKTSATRTTPTTVPVADEPRAKSMPAMSAPATHRATALTPVLRPIRTSVVMAPSWHGGASGGATVTP